MRPGRKRPPFNREFIRHHALVPRFRDAFLGLSDAYREEPNLRFHVFASSCVAVAALAVRTEPWETAYLAVTITAVLLAEMINTAVERTVDYAAAGERHPLAGQAKEIAAGAVLLAALHAVFAALFLFIVRRGPAETVSAVVGLIIRAPWVMILPLLAGILGLVGGRRGSQ
ncbi:MAG TPA: diacylglycerol kinase family protein [Symbiobacteriaceae bacterium]|nr:diacylglycerol kinase family protein [Symbiobacteriaceae bacterium]